jgi:hypothetical protein
MSRLAREFSWHLLALALVIAGLGILAPLTWWQTSLHPARAARLRHDLAAGTDLPLARSAIRRSNPTSNLPPVEPQIASLRPPVADQIHHDPSIRETPALPSGPTAAADEAILGDPRGELRLSATTSKLVLPQLPEPADLGPIRQPADPPSISPDVASPDGVPVTKAWPYPSSLLEQLDILATTTPPAADWAQRAKVELERLVALDTLRDPAVAGPLVRLKALADEAKALAPALDNDHARSKLLRAGYAIVRRIVIWDQVHAIAARHEVVAAPIIDRSSWTRSLAEIDTLLQATGAAANWRKYLLIDRALHHFDSSDCAAGDQRQLARDILHRMHSSQLSHDQEEFLKTPPFTALIPQLEARAAGPLDLTGLLSAIEQYEHDDRSAHSRSLAAQFDTLRWTPDEEVRDLADTLNAYYRNANIRVAISEELLNRMIPQQSPQVMAVGESIVGAWVTGQSQTNTRIRLALVPDPHRWHVGLEAQGEVASNTSSTKGPATFFQDGWSLFRARKRLTVDRRGIRLFSAEAEASVNSSLNDFETNFDGIPLLGDIARAIARNQYEESQPVAKSEVEGKIILQATSQLDREVAMQLEKGKREFQTKLVAPFAQLNLEPTAVSLETTADRLIARYRVAGREQVSAHTPRPQALGDSVLSVQIHETMLNNVLEKLHLSGRRVELRELYREMSRRFQSEKIEVPEDLPEEVYVTFADEDPVRVDCQDGRVRLTIRLKELAQGTKNRWSNFTVRGYYAPNADQLDANLVREGIIELIGDKGNIGIGDQIALRGIFARVLSRNRKIHVVNKRIAEAKELRDQQVTQFVIHDGWMGVALGPKAPGREAKMHPRPEIRGE